MKARAEGEVAANPLGDLSPFSPPCVDFHFTPEFMSFAFSEQSGAFVLFASALLRKCSVIKDSRVL